MSVELIHARFSHRPTEIPEPPVACFLFGDTRMAWFWLIVRVYCGWEWIESRWAKIQNPAWFGGSAGGPLTGFINGALHKTGGDHPDVISWYDAFLQKFVLPNATPWSNVVSLGEMLVGVALISGALTGVAAFVGTVMNANYLFAGTVSTNLLLFVLGTWLVLARHVAGWWGSTAGCYHHLEHHGGPNGYAIAMHRNCRTPKVSTTSSGRAGWRSPLP